jgi:alpha-L-fucosidase
MLLNVGPKPNGEIPSEAQNTLKGIGDWLALNGEAIYDTVPWHLSGEGPTVMNVQGAFSDTKEKIAYTGEDFRFTMKDNILYAISLGWPSKDFTIKSLNDTIAGNVYPGQIQSVKLVGDEHELRWGSSDKGLNIERTDAKPCDHAYVFKIEFNTTV